ncbi:VolA/Pla-1 family phospholipase [Glaciecola siphonariae]|uniref:VolA/Pla-1 family phospholipase n=1 Tax=Glaciecola siphonariae TaxID=521012 RepID=A0ABV9LRN5_9ALTE
MKKLLVSTSIIAALGLAGCGGDETISDIREETQVQTPVSRIVFDPANGDLNIPNDLLMLPGDDGFFDYTLNIPVADPSDFSDPQNALNVLDGWSTNTPFTIDVQTPSGVSIARDTLSSGIRIFEATLGLDQSDPDCAAISIPSAGCKVGDELSFGVDYTLQLLDSDTVSVIPLRPLKEAQGYVLVMTTALRDTTGKSIQGSTTWDLVRQDINTNPLATESQLSLQGLINTHINALEPVGFTRDELTYVSAFTTQSITPVMSTIKQLYVSEFAQRSAAGDPTAGQALPAIVVNTPAGNVMEALGVVSQEAVNGAVALALQNPAAAPLAPLFEDKDFSALTSCNGLLAAAGGQFGPATGQSFAPFDAEANGVIAQIGAGILGQGAGPLCAANLYQGSISLPYYSAIPRAENPAAPANEFWEAACDSGIVLAGAGAALANATPGPNDAFCSALGLRDLRINGQKVDRDRNLTKFNPIPQMKGGNMGRETLQVQVTVPNPAVAAGLGFNISMPEGGWPVVMLVHGITSKKEDMLSISGALSLAGFATVAIDQPLHGTRGFDVDPTNPGDEINATTVSATAFLNLGSLPTARDNSRQAVSDLLGVRLGLNAFVNATGDSSVSINGTNVSLMGVSLGAITGGNFASLANTPFDGQLAPLSGLFNVRAVSLESPGGGLAQFLLESAAFGPLIKGFLLSSASEDFQNFLIATFGTLDVDEGQLVQGTNAFLGALNAEQAAAVNAVFAQFAFAAQTVSDQSDPINFYETLGQNTNVHMLTVIGDGGDNLPDQVIPVSTSVPLSGQLPLATLMDLEMISSTVSSADPLSGIVKYTAGAHASSINPAPNAAVTAEMQTQIATYLGSGGRVIQVTNPGITAN